MGTRLSAARIRPDPRTTSRAVRALFPTLPLFASDTSAVRDALKVLGEKGGIMDAADETDIGANPNLARDLITDPALSVSNPNNPALTAGMTFLGPGTYLNFHPPPPLR